MLIGITILLMEKLTNQIIGRQPQGIVSNKYSSEQVIELLPSSLGLVVSNVSVVCFWNTWLMQSFYADIHLSCCKVGSL